MLEPAVLWYYTWKDEGYSSHMHHYTPPLRYCDKFLTDRKATGKCPAVWSTDFNSWHVPITFDQASYFRVQARPANIMACASSKALSNNVEMWGDTLKVQYVIFYI